MKRRWTIEELDCLKESWGTVNIDTIATNLNRSINSIMLKTQREGLPRYIDGSCDYITYNQLMLILFGKVCNSYQNKSWIENRSFPVCYKKIIQKKIRIVYFNDFWKWAEKNRTFINFSKLEKNALGKEPIWVDEQRKADKNYSIYKQTPWTDFEEQMLISLLKLYRYSYKDISDRLKRTEASIKERIYVLGLKQRPVKEKCRLWTEDETKILTDMLNKGYKTDIIAKHLDRTALAINGRIERMVKNGTFKKTEASVVLS